MRIEKTQDHPSRTASKDQNAEELLVGRFGQMRELADLCAGPPRSTLRTEPEFSAALRALHGAIRRSGTVMRRRLHTTNAGYDTTPLVARKLLEECAAAILGRVDPVRLVVAFNGPKAPDFKIGDHNRSSFNWTNDVVAKFESEGAQWTPWNQATLKNGPVRSLLDGHLGNYLFDSAHARVIDALQSFYRTRSTLPDWVLAIQRFAEGKPLMLDLQRRARAAYSSLSKGIHFEFFADGSGRIAEQELRASLVDVAYVASTSALYSHLSDVSLRSLGEQSAMVRFDAVAAAFSLPQPEATAP